MWAAEAWQEDNEEARIRRRFGRILLASALLHLLVLLTVKFPPKDRSGAGFPVLTVMFKAMTPAPVRLPEPLPVTQESPPPRLLSQDAVAPAARVATKPPQVREPIKEVKPVVAEAPLPSAAINGTSKPVPGRDARTAPATGGVSVLMAIGEDGRVTEILWNRLPALTNEQFKRLENMLRANVYAASMAGTTVTEVVDVRGILGLQPERSRSAPDEQ